MISRRKLAGDAVRYWISGGVLAVLYSGVYWSLAVPLAVPALVANTIAFGINLVAGWLIHSRWSFGQRKAATGQRVLYARFFVVNILSYALNTLWVWLIVERLELGVPLSIVPVVTVTPILTFSLSRAWIFGGELEKR